MMNSAPALPPFAPRPLGGAIAVEPDEVSVFSGHDEPTEIHRTTKAHGILSRPDVSVNGQIVAAGGWPAPIRRTASFAVIPRPPKTVNIVVGVKGVPGNARRSR